MEAREKVLTIAPAAWSPEAALVLARTVGHAPCFRVDDYRAMLDREPECQLYRVALESDELVGYAILRVARYAGGAEGEIVAACGALAGVDLTRQVLPALEGFFRGVRSLRIHTHRPGLVHKLEACGWTKTHTVMRKVLL